MAEKKRPRRTRERILETALALFNRHGAPQVTTADIADEMSISPGNLYYHFGNKDEIVVELYERYEASVRPLYADRGGRPLDVDDLWLWLHLLFESMWKYRFLYRDIDQLTSQSAKMGARFGALLRKAATTVIQLCEGLTKASAMHASEREIESLAQNVVLVSAYWLSYDRVRRSAENAAADGHAGRAAYQVLALFAPYLDGTARAYFDQLAAEYL